MKERKFEGHLTPEELIDLLDGSPVNADRKQHMTGCRGCAREFAVLEETLSQLQQSDVPNPGENYWQEFDSGLQRKLRKTTTKDTNLSWYWHVAAAATFALFSWQMANLLIPEPAEPASIESLLPAMEDDAEFLFLVSIIELSGWTEDLEESLAWGSAPSLDLSQLTEEEAARFRRELEDEMGDEHAKS